ncbi:hypothetical protein ABB37_05642 [Leptomonas pyrrhocoris]|uniref:Uncharacterized protein n=1 Tax=Leptomonas pyrrhocoris TaxID=157538 RepID=A0A0N0DUV4_LEPPY|nr:hypothetical protein ABB37_05642 [Leptomonas pyrrhocoris]KPA79131.1 hypothetical protein ABB37_05642 [Leptomonas pyrrhocoris]|eukprot:XP_015657570.1 hypothetical protein ABB37_05642 [Leptomonas pyrrhocoris]
MSNTEIAFFVFPTGVGEEDVRVRGEVPVLPTAVADTASTLSTAVDAVPMTSPPPPELLPLELRARHVRFESVPSPTTLNGAAASSPQGHHTAVNGAVISLTSSSSAAAATTATTATVSATSAAPSTELTIRMHYMAASYLSELQRGAALARRLSSSSFTVSSSGSLLSSLGGYVQLAGGQRCYYVCPIEDGRYLAAACLPFGVWHQLGGGDGAAYTDFLVRTALTGTALSPSAFRKGSTAEMVCYASLHTRLASNPQLVQQSMAARVKRIAHVSKAVAFHPHRYAARVAALHRLCREGVSSLRTHPRLAQRVEELMRAATGPTSTASLRGVMPTMGLTKSEHRYVLAASSLWYRGHPLYTSLTASGAQLRSAALSVLLEELEKLSCTGEDVSYQGSDSTPASVTAQCFCVGWSGHNASSARPTASGYVSQPTRTGPAPSPSRRTEHAATAAQPCVVSMAFTSSAGWTVALLLQPMRTPYLGTPLSTIFTGVQTLVTDTFADDGFVRFVREATAALRSTWRRPVHLLSPLAAQLETAVMAIRVGQRPLGAVAAPDKVLYFLDVAAAAAAQLASKATSSSSPFSRCASPFAALRLTSKQNKMDKQRKASFIASYAAAQRSRSLGDTDDCPPYATMPTNTSDTKNNQSTSGCFPRCVEAVVQAAARYVHLAAQIQRCSQRQGRGVRPTLPSHGAAPPLLLQHQRRSQAVFSVVAEKDTVILVKAVPSCGGGGTSGVLLPFSKAQRSVLYVVVELEKKKMPASAHDELRAFASWVLARCL